MYVKSKEAILDPLSESSLTYLHRQPHRYVCHNSFQCAAAVPTMLSNTRTSGDPNLASARES
jgi:hypothetical protein